MSLQNHRWTTLPDEKLLDRRFCDLDLKVQGTAIERNVRQLHRELGRRGIRFRPHTWLSTDFFSPDGVPGIAIPFYLAHPRLIRLEERQMLEAEGATSEWLMRILRHEAGHAIDSAYRLRRKKAWRKTFGRASTPYPESYIPKPVSREFVLNLDWWYAQSHPVEDFAETFAVWLQPGSSWRNHYRDWPALRKLQAVDGMMREISDAPPPVQNLETCDEVSSLRRTLRRHYNAKRKRYGEEFPDFYDEDLRRLFPDGGRADNRSAAAFLRRIGPEIRQRVSKWTGQHPYTIDQVLREMIVRCRALKLRVTRPKREIRTDTIILLTVETMNFLYGGHSRVAL